jgi:hypothetical protein
MGWLSPGGLASGDVYGQPTIGGRLLRAPGPSRRVAGRSAGRWRYSAHRLEPGSNSACRHAVVASPPVLSQISGVAGVVVASAEDSGLAWKRSVSVAAMATVLPGLADEVEFAAGVGVFGRGRAASAAGCAGWHCCSSGSPRPPPAAPGHPRHHRRPGRPALRGHPRPAGHPARPRPARTAEVPRLRAATADLTSGHAAPGV